MPDKVVDSDQVEQQIAEHQKQHLKLHQKHQKQHLKLHQNFQSIKSIESSKTEHCNYGHVEVDELARAIGGEKTRGLAHSWTPPHSLQIFSVFRMQIFFNFSERYLGAATKLPANNLPQIFINFSERYLRTTRLPKDILPQ